jgi:hypothetical protein
MAMQPVLINYALFGYVNRKVKKNFFIDKIRPGVNVVIIILGDLRQFSAGKKRSLFLKFNEIFQFLYKPTVIWAKKCIFRRKYFKIIT